MLIKQNLSAYLYKSYIITSISGETVVVDPSNMPSKDIVDINHTYKSLPVLEEKYGTITEIDNILEVSKEELPKTALTVYRILNKHKYR